MIERTESESCAQDKAPFLIDNCLATVNQQRDYSLITLANCEPSNNSINAALWLYLEQIAGALRAGHINPIKHPSPLFISLFFLLLFLFFYPGNGFDRFKKEIIVRFEFHSGLPILPSIYFENAELMMGNYLPKHNSESFILTLIASLSFVSKVQHM